MARAERATQAADRSWVGLLDPYADHQASRLQDTLRAALAAHPGIVTPDQVAAARDRLALARAYETRALEWPATESIPTSTFPVPATATPLVDELADVVTAGLGPANDVLGAWGALPEAIIGWEPPQWNRAP